MWNNFLEYLKKIKIGINIMYSYTKLYIIGAIKLLNKKTDDGLYSSLGATDKAEGNEAYEEALDSAISNANNLNIAVMGKFSSGKSSVIKTYFKKPENALLSPIYISLASFNGIKVPAEEKGRNEYFQSIEKSILQQIFYNVKNNKAPHSSFKRINKISKRKIIRTALELVLLLGATILFVNPYSLDFFIDNYNVLVLEIGTIATIFVVILSFIFLIVIMYNVIYFTRTNFNISKFKFKDAEIEINGKNESLFNRFVDEILYFFEVTPHSVVIIEDLDRFAEPTIVFTKLREMNLLINNSSQIKRRIVFIYAMKDDFFIDHTDRTKFFDFILPVIPYVSAVNSNEILWQKLSKNLELSDLDSDEYSDINKEFINDISVYISESRTIDNVVNEFSLFKKKLNKTKMSDKGLLSVIVYKNLFPRKYNDLASNQGFLFDFIRNKRELSDKLKAKIEDSNNELSDDKNKIIEDALNGVQEIKEVYISRLSRHEGQIVTGFRLNDDSSISAQDFLELEDDDIFEKIYSFQVNHYSDRIPHNHPVYSTFGGYDILINRVKNIGNNKEKKLDLLEEKIEINKSKIEDIDTYEISTFFSKMNMGDFTKNLNVFEIFLLRRGYISEDYRNYINVFHEGDITESDFNYILTVKRNSTLSYEYEINNLKNTILRLDISDFVDTNFLNNNIVEEIISNNEHYPKQFKELTNILNRHSDRVIEFNSQFIKRINNKQGVIPILFENMNDGLMQIIKIKKDETEVMHSIIDAFLKYVSIDPKNKLSMMIAEYIEENADVDYLFEEYSDERMNKFKKLNIRLKTADIENKPYSSHIYDNFIFSFCEKHLYGYFRYKGFNVEETLKKHLTAISTSDKLEELYKHVVSNMDHFIDEFYRYTDDTEEDEKVLLNILSEIHDIGLRNDLINIIKIQFSDINNELMDNQTRDSILIAGKFKGTWDNLDSIFRIYSEEENIPDEYDDFESLVASFFELNYTELNKAKWPIINDNLTNMGYIMKSKKISTSILEQTVGSIPIILDISSSSFDKMDLDRLEMLIQNNKIQLTVNVINKLISNEKHELASKVVMNNVEKFIEEIDKYQVDEELVGACLLNEEATDKDKLLLLNNIDVENVDIALVNNISKEFFIEKVNPKEIHKYNETLVELYFKLQENEEYILSAIHDLLINNVSIYNFTSVSNVGEISKIGDNEAKYAKITKSEIGFEVADLLKEKNIIRNYIKLKKDIRLTNNKK